ncbi:type I restriction-modification system endonuclease [Olivibacter sp. SDN3]|uniref:type I restriction-modification system endonuclease n=1 Tax=Olivibacter sp. SDN3 TaxID=2764720 RepID=UPI0016515296|nr:type I restriction-modification system endonuclease [Olivibacter sp. SDN3]QNL48950.1 type I restriction-modification system endonuclease [Olivibacter sp. SDN3]
MAETSFHFLEEEFPLLFNLAKAAEYNLYQDPTTSLFKLRQYGEYMAKQIFDTYGMDLPEDSKFQNLVYLLRNQGILPSNVYDYFTILRKQGNDAVHEYKGTTDEATSSLFSAFKLGKWFYESYSVKNRNIADIKFHKPENLDARHALYLLEQENKALKEQYDQLILQQKTVSQEQRQAFTERAKRSASKLDMDEAQTRELIDVNLRKMGWEADTKLLNAKIHKTQPEKGRNMAIAEWPVKGGYADYALFIGTSLYGVVEAKKYGQDISTNLDQSKRYALNIIPQEGIEILGEWQGYKVPFLYSTNGREYLQQIATKSGIWYLDVRETYNNSKSIKGFHSPDDLRKKFEQDIALANKKLQANSLDFLQSKTGLSLRDYQIKAIEAVETIVINHPEVDRALLAMATGTGKTRTIIGLAYRLIQTNRFKRILFLVDRTLLAKQALDGFKDYKVDDLKSFNDIYHIDNLRIWWPDVDSRIHFATVQSMVKRLFYHDDEQKSLSIDTYDCIIVDEAHRGYLLDKEMDDEELDFKDQDDYVSKYRQVLDYFDAFAIGLTATPALHTTEIFNKPVFNYGLREAVLDGYLVDQDPPIMIKTKLSEEGIVWEKGERPTVYDKEGNQIIELDELDDELKFDVSGFNKQVITENFNRTVLRELVNQLDPDGEAKTLIFAATDEHADMIVKILKEEFAVAGIPIPDDAVAKITGKSDQPEDKVKRYKNEQYPNIAVTVDLLTTGIDVPKICNLVFMRRIRSRILYDQMIGRATRLCPEIHKESFKVFDAVNLYESIKDYTEMKPLVVNPSANFATLSSEFRHIQTDERAAQQVDQIIAKLQRKKRSTGIDNEKINYFTGVGSLDEFIHSIREKTLPEQVKLLTDSNDLWKYLDEFKSAPARQFYSNHEDELREVVAGYGTSDKPEDYIEGFKQFIEENQNNIASLKLIATAPTQLKRSDLKELLILLDTKGYTVRTLREAWKSTKKQDVAADIIAYIRTLILGSELVSKEDRVRQAFQKLYSEQNWTVPQKNLLVRIEAQMIAESVVTVDDLDKEPFVSTYGGFNRINQRFDNHLPDILQKINSYMYGGNQTA